MMNASPGFDDLNIALRMRELVNRMVREEVDRYRPREQYGRAIDVNRTALTCQVLLNGDVEPIKVKMSSMMQPLETDTLNGIGKGCMVLVGGASGNYWIKQIASGHAYSSGEAFANPKIWGGPSGDLDVATHFTKQALLPAVGSVYHVGRWDNSNSVVQDGRGYLFITVRQDLFSSLMKTYEVSLKVNSTNSVWQKLVSSTDHGIASGNDFELEIMSDATGFELRIRRTKDGGGFTPGPYTLSMWAHMDSLIYDDTNVGESAAAAATTVFGTTTVADDNGPFLSYGLNFNNRAQFNMHGGGHVYMNNSTNFFSWDERFLMYGQGRSQLMPSGFLEITQPPNGTAVPVYGETGVTSVTATAAGIPLQSNQTLYYEMPYGASVTTSVATNFRIVAHSDTAQLFTVPSHWVMIAARASSLSQSGDTKLGNGMTLNGPQWDTWAVAIDSATGSPANGNATVSGRYIRIGKTVHWNINYTCGSTTNPGSGNSYFTLPVNARSASQALVGFGELDRSGLRYNFTAHMSGVTKFLMVGNTNNGEIWQLSVAGKPITGGFSTGDEIRAQGTYESV